MTRNGKLLLNAGGIMNTAVGCLHLGIVFFGAPAYRYFRAGERMAQLAEAGSIVPVLVTSGLAVMFFVCALYAFSAAGTVRRLPLLKPAVIAIGVVYVLRGVLMIPTALFVWMQRHMIVEGRDIVFSVVAAIIGLLYLAGMRLESARLKPQAEYEGGVK